MKSKTKVAEKAVSAKPRNKRVVFTVRAEPGSEVSISGDFNNWCPEGRVMADKKRNGHYTVAMNLAPGIYEYKFIINKTWCVDPACKDWVPNSFGTLNSVLHVE